ncbi:hypothetical protein CC79DRAFT_1360910 [Sarocladium strictum]
MAHNNVASTSQPAGEADRPLCQIITPVGMLGYGFDEILTHNELFSLTSSGIPTGIILDSGSTDSGPQKLAIGSMSCPRSAYANDLTKLLKLCHNFRVPLLFSSAGGDGSDEHVREMEEIVEEIAEANQEYNFKTISIYSGIIKPIILSRLREGRVTGCGPVVPALTETDVLESYRVVAQIGPEPFVDAMDAEPDFDVIIGGRAYDPAPYAAFCIHQLKQQYPRITATDIKQRLGGFLHMGKIMECGGHCAFPKSHGAVSTVYANGVFDVRPTAPGAKCTPLSVSAHALYENTRPDILRGPGGMMLLSDSRYEALADGRSVRVSGTSFQSSRKDGKPYQLKLEAARIVGYRAITMGTILIAQLDKVLPLVRGYVKQQHQHVDGNWDIGFHTFGKDKKATSDSTQVFIVAEALAQTQDIANSLASKARVALIKATAGNFGFGIAGLMEIETGPCAEFSVYHVMDLNPGEEHLPLDNDAAQERLIHSSMQIIGSGLPRAARSPIENTIIQQTKSKSTVDKVREAQPSDPGPAKSPKVLADLCRVLRSKNAGPYEITIDAMFYTEADYKRIKNSGILSRERIAQAIGIAESDVIWMGFFDSAQAFKVTFPRIRNGKPKSAGGFMEDDIHGSQEHTGLHRLKLLGQKGKLPAMMLWLGGMQHKLKGWRALLTTMAGIGFLLSLIRQYTRRKNQK